VEIESALHVSVTAFFLCVCFGDVFACNLLIQLHGIVSGSKSSYNFLSCSSLSL